MKTLTKRERTEVVPEKKKRDDALQLLEHAINTIDAEAWVGEIQTGLNLMAIKDGELYRTAKNPLTGEYFTNFREYIETPIVDNNGIKHYRFLFDIKEANRRIRNASSYQLLRSYKEEKHLDLPLPDNAYQMRPIAKLPYAKQAPRYFQAAEHARRCEVNLTSGFLTLYLKNGELDPEVDPPPAIHDIVPTVDDDSEADVLFPDALDEPVQKRYHPDAQIALNRIEQFSRQHIFPDSAAKAIRDLSLEIDDEDLAMWGRFLDEDFVPIGRLIFRNKISFTTARRFHASCKSPVFLDRIVLYAISKGSSVSEIHNGFHIQIRPLPTP